MGPRHASGGLGRTPNPVLPFAQDSAKSKRGQASMDGFTASPANPTRPTHSMTCSTLPTATRSLCSNARPSDTRMPPLLKIRTERGQMSAIERRIADFILDNAHLLRDYSSQQLASALGISQSSVVKFSQKLGFKGYPDLKYSIGQDVARAGADPQQAPDEPDSGDDYLRLGEALRRSKAQAEEETRQANPRAEIERIVQLLDGAPKLFVYGLGDDGLFAREFAMRLSLLGLLVVPHTDPILMLANLSAARPGDALLVFSEFGNLPQLSQLSRQFQDMGAR